MMDVMTMTWVLLSSTAANENWLAQLPDQAHPREDELELNQYRLPFLCVLHQHGYICAHEPVRRSW
jgi:hypothetical protein